MPTGKQWETFSIWGEKWGDVVSISVLGTDIVWFNSLKAATGFLDKKSRICSNRPAIPLAGELVGWNDIAAFLQNGDDLKQFRKLFHTFIGTSSSLVKLHPIHELGIHRLLKNLLARPQNFEADIMHAAGSILLHAIYGVNEDKLRDHLNHTVDRAVQDLYEAADGKYLVNALPILRFVPSWFPGAQFKRHANIWSVGFHKMVEEPYAWIKQHLVQVDSNIAPSFVGNLLHEGVETEATIKHAAASMSAAGPDTTGWTMYAFFKAMALFPDVQARARAEIDAVIGTERLPNMMDRAKLPYIEAMVHETIRWHTVSPFGFPHILTEDVIHDGYFLPKGTIVQANILGITQDPSVYPNPAQYDPARFIAASENEQPQPYADCIFGWGRRTCPGKLMAQEIIFLTIAQTLAAFTIEKPEGVVINVEREEGIVSRPSKFECIIKPRNNQVVSLINELAT